MKTVLLIEDNIQNARLILRVLEPRGYRCLHAADGESGLQMARERQPDLILVDLGLPDLDGETVVSFIRRLPELAQVPIVAVTAWPPDTAEKIARAYGCDGFISKPISPRVFPEQVAVFLNRNPVRN